MYNYSLSQNNFKITAQDKTTKHQNRYHISISHLKNKAKTKVLKQQLTQPNRKVETYLLETTIKTIKNISQTNRKQVTI